MKLLKLNFGNPFRILAEIMGNEANHHINQDIQNQTLIEDIFQYSDVCPNEK